MKFKATKKKCSSYRGEIERKRQKTITDWTMKNKFNFLVMKFW